MKTTQVLYGGPAALASGGLASDTTGLIVLARAARYWPYGPDASSARAAAFQAA